MSVLHRHARLLQRFYGILDQGLGPDSLGTVADWALIDLSSSPSLRRCSNRCQGSRHPTPLHSKRLNTPPWWSFRSNMSCGYGPRSNIRRGGGLVQFYPPFVLPQAPQDSPSGLIDLAAVAPFWLSFFVAADFKAFLVLRLIRFFKLTRYSPAMRSLL